jgi:hypothetical protein
VEEMNKKYLIFIFLGVSAELQVIKNNDNEM